jgi:hypothetical protein
VGQALALEAMNKEAMNKEAMNKEAAKFVGLELRHGPVLLC